MSRASTSSRRCSIKDVDGRNKSGHDLDNANYSRNFFNTFSGIALDLSLPLASRTTQTLFSEHSAHVSPFRLSLCSTSKLERPKVIVLSTVTSSPKRVGFRNRARVRTSG